MKKRIIGIFMVLCMMSGLMSFMTFPALAATSGTCGDNLTWELDNEGTLTISGEGDMEDYTDLSSSRAPWYSSQTSITNVVIENGVTTIGDYALYGCTSLTSITIPDSVTSIGGRAFYRCSSLTSITISDSVTSIGNYALYGCTSLTEFIVSDENMYYFSDEGGVLYNKNKTTLIQYPAGKTDASYIIPDSVTSIKAYAFYNCTSLLSVTIGSSVTSIGSHAFLGCNSLTNITIPDSVTSIGDGAFSYCESLTSVTIPDGVTSIGEGAFYGCTSLTSVTIPDSVASIGEYAFLECYNLTSVNITSIEAWCRIAFGDEYANPLGYVTNLYLNGNLVTNLSIPDSVTSIGQHAFRNLTSLVSITIPDSVTSIGNYAFRGCKNLTSVTIGNGVTSIGAEAFFYCDSLEKFIVSNNNMYYSSDEGGVLFNKEQTTLIQYPARKTDTSYIIPDSVTSIGDMAFRKCKSLTSVTIPDGVTSIEMETFAWCQNLTSINIPNSVTSIGRSAFYNCDLTSINIPDSVTSIGSAAFEGCYNLTSIEIPDSVTGIEHYTFRNCGYLTSITIHNSVTSIGSAAFEDCDRLTTVNYNGNEEMWNEISIYNDNECLTDAARNYFWYVTYIDENGNVIQRDMVTINTTVTLPDFSDIGETYGFYTDSAFTEEFDASVPITGNTVIYVAPPAPYIINSITIKDLSGNVLSEIPNGKFLATVSITNNSLSNDSVVVLGQYSALGKLNGLMYVSVEDMTKGSTFKLTLPVDNTAGDVGKLNAFVWESFESMKALGNSMSFPAE